MKKLLYHLIPWLILATACNNPDDQSGKAPTDTQEFKGKSVGGINISADDIRNAKTLQELIQQEEASIRTAKSGNGTPVKQISRPAAVKSIAASILAKKGKSTGMNYVEAEALAKAYFRTHSSAAITQVMQQLKSKDDEVVKDILLYLILYPAQYPGMKAAVTEPELIRKVQQHYHHANPLVVLRALQLAANFDFPDWVEDFGQMLPKAKNIKIRRILISLLAEFSGSDLPMDLLEQWYQDGSWKAKVCKPQQNGGHRIGGMFSLLKTFNQRKYPERRNRAKTLLWKMYDDQVIPREDVDAVLNKGNYHGGANSLVNSIIEFGGERAIPFAEQVKDKGEFVNFAYPALVETWYDMGNYPKARARAKAYFKRGGAYCEEQLLWLYENTGKQELIRDLFEGIGDDAEELFHWLKTFGAEEALAHPERYSKDKKQIANLKAFLKTQNISVEDLARELMKMGLLDSMLTQEEAGEIRNNVYRPTVQQLLNEIMNYTGIQLWYDTEAGIIPVDYASLLENLFSISNGIMQDALAGMESGGLYELRYTVTLVFKGTAYTVHPPSIEDWFHSKTVTGLLNAALEGAGLPERYNEIPSTGQEVRVIFGKPEQVTALMEKYDLVY